MELVHRVKSDDCVFRKFRAIGFPETLIKHRINDDLILIMEHRNVTLRTTMRKIYDYRLLSEQPHKNHLPNISKKTYNFPFNKFEFVEGDPEWLTKLYSDYGWKLNKTNGHTTITKGE